MTEPLLPTPQAGGNRKSKAALRASTGGRSRRSSPPGLEQVVEILDGTVPREIAELGDDLPPMTRRLLPTPQAADGERQSETMYRGEGNPTLLGAVRSATAPSSPVEEDSTSDSDGQAGRSPSRSSGTTPPGPASNDGGRLFPVTETSGRPMPLLPTPNAMDGERPFETPEQWQTRRERKKAENPRLGDLQKPLEVIVLSASLRSKPSSEDSPASPPPTQDDAAAPTTTVGSGPPCSVWFASFDPDSCSWRTSQASLLSTEETPFERWSGTWPPTFELKVGASGEASVFVPPTWALPTDGSGSSSSSMLPTPNASLGTAGHSSRSGDRKDELLLAGIVRSLLPTPRTSDANGPGVHGEGGGDLRTIVSRRSTGASTPPPSEGGKP